MTAIWNESDLVSATKGKFYSHHEITGTGVSIDTRTLKKGDIFIAIHGEHSNGHTYIKQALEKGASCVIISEDIPNTDLDNFLSNYPILKVNDTLEALTNMGHYARQRFQGKTIAITGSVGKTTTKEMLKIALMPFGNVHAAEGSYNNHLGVPLTLSRLPLNAKFCICEIGMNHQGEIAPLAHIVKPDIAIITTVASAHLGQMKSLDSIAQEKSEIITALSKESATIIPENIYGMAFFEALATQYSVHLYKTGSSSHADFQIQDVQLLPECSSFNFKTEKNIYPVTLNAPGEHLIHDAALVLSCVNKLQLHIHQSISALQDFQTGSGRGKIIPLIQKQGCLLDESYNASTLSIQSALQTLSLLGTHRRIAILGDILELGEYAKQEHLSLLPDIIKNTDLVFACGDNMKIVFEHLPPSLQGKWQTDAASLIPFIQRSLYDGDTILVKGSHGMHMKIIVEALTQENNKRKN